MDKKKKAIGIIGGMGPLATADLFSKIIQFTDAKNDQEHIQVFIDSNTNIPDRTAAILYGGNSPVNEMVRSAVKLESMGADVLIMPCNTAHYYYKQVLPFVKIPFLNMLEETAKAIVEKGIEKIGLLATDGTINSGVYDDVLEKFGVSVEKPDEKGQSHVMDVIYKGIKAGKYNLDTAPFLECMDQLLKKGAQTMVLGCTELPIAFERFQIGMSHVDPTCEIAKSAICFAGGKLKH